MDDQKIVEKAVQQAIRYEETFHGCAQCVLGGIMDAFDVDAPIAFRAATGLSGGMGSTGRTCGALTGGILAIGLFVGRDYADMKDLKRRRWENFALVKELIERYEDAFGSIVCREVQERIVGIGVDFWDPQQVKRFAHEYDGHTKCAERVVGEVTRWTAEIIIRYLNRTQEQHD